MLTQIWHELNMDHTFHHLAARTSQRNGAVIGHRGRIFIFENRFYNGFSPNFGQKKVMEK